MTGHDRAAVDAATPRDTLQRLAVHVMARAQHAATGRIGLRPTPGGFATIEHGSPPRRLRVSDGRLVVEDRTPAGSVARVVDIDGSSLRTLADVAGVTLTEGFTVGHDTPPLGDPDELLRLDADSAVRLGAWFGLVARVLDHVIAGAAVHVAPSLPQLWPEHFDLAIDLAFDPSAPEERRVNVGGSPGDGYHADPYLYVGPWTSDRPGDPDYWNAPFGAVVGAADLLASDEPVRSAVEFVRRGLALLAR